MLWKHNRYSKAKQKFIIRMDDDSLSLPADTLKILNEFLQEKAKRELDEQRNVESQAGKEATFEEDWQLSQFWYNAFTKQALGDAVKQLLAQQKSVENYHIALLSCPSLYATIKDLHEHVKIFEYDRRFSAYGTDFVYYDFNDADTSNYLKDYQAKFDLIIADPPFLAEECITKICNIITNLRKPCTKIIFCSGEIVEPWLIKDLALHKCNFQPQHERNLGNEFVSYANFNLDNFVNVNK